MHNESNEYRALKEILTEDKPVSFRPVLKRITGNYCAALMLAQLLYWTPRSMGEWIYKTDVELGAEICASRGELGTARAALTAKGLIETKRMGQPARMHYRVNIEAVMAAIVPSDAPEPETPEEVAETPEIEGPATSCRDSQLQGKPATSCRDHSQTSCRDSLQLSITENTTESTTCDGADAHAFAPSGIRSEATSPRAARDPFAIQADFDALAAAGRARGADRTAAAHPLAGRWPHLVDLARAFEDASGLRLADLPKSQAALWSKQLEGHYQADLTPDDERELVRLAKAKKWDLYSPGSADKLIGHLRRQSPSLTEPTYAKPSF